MREPAKTIACAQIDDALLEHEPLELAARRGRAPRQARRLAEHRAVLDRAAVADDDAVVDHDVRAEDDVAPDGRRRAEDEPGRDGRAEDHPGGRQAAHRARSLAIAATTRCAARPSP